MSTGWQPLLIFLCADDIDGKFSIDPQGGCPALLVIFKWACESANDFPVYFCGPPVAVGSRGLCQSMTKPHSGANGSHTTSLGTLTELNLMAADFPHRDVGIVLEGHAGTIFVWDIDKEGVTERMERETGKTLPETYVVQSQPETAPYKRHVYFRQTDYFASQFQKQVNAGDYDLKGFGGGQVVAEGCVRKDTGRGEGWQWPAGLRHPRLLDRLAQEGQQRPSCSDKC
jgi:hypothetical protein